MIKVDYSKFYVLLLLLSVGAFSGYAQAISLYDYHSNVKSVQSPNSSSLGRFGAVPVNMFTGTPNITVPLLSINYGEIHLPVELTYNASGIRVSEQPGWAGLGWSLIPGGQISRKVNNIQDEFNNIHPNMIGNQTVKDKGYYFTGAELNTTDWNSTSFMTNKLNSYNSQFSGFWSGYIWDGEPDEFQFNFGAYSGSFYRSETGEWKVKSKQNITFEIVDEMVTGSNGLYRIYNFESTVGYERVASLFTKFIMTTPDGFKYTFGGDEAAIEFSRGQIGPYGVRDPANEEAFSHPNVEHRANYITANTWYLTKIETPKGDVVTLTYKRGKPLFQKYKTYMPGFMDGTAFVSSPQAVTKVSAINPSYLAKIETPFQIVEFITSLATELKMSPEVIATPSMTAADFKNSIVCNWTDLNIACGTLPMLEIPRFNEQLDSIKVFDKQKNDYTNGVKLYHSALVTKRRTLDSLVNFSYLENTAGGKYKFGYDNVESLPAYESLRRDHYGLYNGGTEPAAGSSTLPIREPSLGFCLFGLLNRITYPTGGATNFEFEPGSYSKYIKVDPDNTANTIQLIDQEGNAGVRIKKITSKADYGAPDVVKEYFYQSNYIGGAGISSGILAWKPKSTDIINYTVSWGSLGGANCNGTFEASNYADDNSEWLDQVKGGYISYSEVTEKSSDGSLVVYKYANHDQAAFRDEKYDNFAYADVSWTGSTVFTVNSNTNYRITANDLERGNILSERYYKPGNQKVKEVTYEYTNSPSRKSNYIKAFGHKELVSTKVCGTISLGSVPRGWTYKI